MCVKKVSKICQKSWFSENSSALCAVKESIKLHVKSNYQTSSFGGGRGVFS